MNISIYRIQSGARTGFTRKDFEITDIPLELERVLKINKL